MQPFAEILLWEHQRLAMSIGDDFIRREALTISKRADFGIFSDRRACVNRSSNSPSKAAH